MSNHNLTLTQATTMDMLDGQHISYKCDNCHNFFLELCLTACQQVSYKLRRLAQLVLGPLMGIT